MEAKKTNPTDTTLRNNAARKKVEAKLLGKIKALEKRVKILEQVLTKFLKSFAKG